MNTSDGAANDQFGQAVAINGDAIVVGVDAAAGGGMADRGTVYVFEYDQDGATDWRQDKKIVALFGAGCSMLVRKLRDS